jgi:hypothetical protein
VIAIADDGCRLDHPAFGCPEKFTGAAYFDENGLQTCSAPLRVAEHLYSPGRHHGTSMCTLIAAAVGSGQTVGVAPECKLLPIRLRTFQNRIKMSDDEILYMLDYVDEQADIFVMPWSKFPSLVLSREIVERVEKLTVEGGRRRKGLMIVCAAGNSNCPIHFSSDRSVPYHVNFPSGNTGDLQVHKSKTFRNILTTIPGVLHVSSISSLAQRCHYSCYGLGIDLCAPSSNSRSFRGDKMNGLGLTTSYGDPATVTHNFKGTSGAAALVAGVAALALSANENLSGTQVRRILEQSASKDLNLSGYLSPSENSPDAVWDMPPIPPFDHGDFNETGWSPWFGYGKVDALGAVLLAQNISKFDFIQFGFL